MLVSLDHSDLFEVVKDVATGSVLCPPVNLSGIPAGADLDPLVTSDVTQPRNSTLL
jgi:hypothetical protein